MYKPLFPYKDNQIIITSDRICLNSKLDSIFLFSNKAIGLSANEGIHLNTEKECIINSSNIQLGINAKEPLVKGNALVNLLNKLLNDLESTGNQLNSAVDSNGNAIPGVQTAGNNLVRSSKRIRILLKSINSTQNFTI